MRCVVIHYRLWYGPGTHVFQNDKCTDAVLERKANRWAEINLSAQAYETCTMTFYGDLLDRDTAKILK